VCIEHRPQCRLVFVDVEVLGEKSHEISQLQGKTVSLCVFLCCFLMGPVWDL